jgi:hypothetical protein
MKKHPIPAAILAVGLLACLFSACEEEEPDPCAGIEPKKPGFTIYENINNYGGADTLIATDTALTYNTVVFEANDDYDTYAWKIGDAPRVFTTKRVALRFDEPYPEIKVELAVGWQPSDCFPEETGADTTHRSLTILHRDFSPLVGVFRGSLQSDPSRLFNVSIETIESFAFRLVNLNEGCQPNYNRMVAQAGYHALNFHCDDFYVWDGCLSPNGWLFLSADHQEIDVRFTIVGPANRRLPAIPDRFVGKRMQ